MSTDITSPDFDVKNTIDTLLAKEFLKALEYDFADDRIARIVASVSEIEVEQPNFPAWFVFSLAIDQELLLYGDPQVPDYGPKGISSISAVMEEIYKEEQVEDFVSTELKL